MVITVGCVAWVTVQARSPKSGLQGTIPRKVGTEIIRLQFAMLRSRYRAPSRFDCVIIC